MTKPIRIGIIGLDHWYAAIPFAQQVAANAETELVGIVDRDLARAREVATPLGCTQVGTDPADLIADPSVDAVACFTTVAENPANCIAAAAAGKHIVSVKPMAMTLEDADRVVAAVETAGVVFVPSEARRTSPLAEWLGSFVLDGRLGELRAATFTMNSTLPQSWPGLADPGWWVDSHAVPGGAWLDHAVYHIERMRWLFDSPVASITGRVANIAYPQLAVEDYGHAVLTLQSGAIVSVEDTWIASPGGFTSRGYIIGSAGSLVYNTADQFVGVSLGDGGWSFSKCPADQFDTLGVLIRALRHGVAPPAGVRDARDVLRICLDFYAQTAGA